MTVADKSLKERMFGLAQCSWDGKIQFTQGGELRIGWTEAGVLDIEAPDLSGRARGLFLAAQSIKNGKPFPPPQKRHFASCGGMLDVSRGGVLKVAAVKKWIDCQAALGLNLLMLYTEDIYEIKEYPHFGYMRGRYSKEELSEIDLYAYESGIELVPCIQTLAHLSQFLQWSDSETLKDTGDCLLIDDEETHRFVEAEISAIRQCFRSNRIHIGMDEAHGVGLGRYFLKYGQTNRYDLLIRHLNRVVSICEKYNFAPIMWSDMFFRIGSKDNEYYDLDVNIPQAVADAIPNVALCYWDYYHFDEDFYHQMLNKHASLDREIVFACGNWTWTGFLPHIKRTKATMVPGLRACLEHGVQTVIATLWEDDGCETDHFLGMPQMAILSEYCWLGSQCTDAEIDSMGSAVSGLDTECFASFGDFYIDNDDNRPGKGLFYCDLLYLLTYQLWDLNGYDEQLKHAIDVLTPRVSDPRCLYAYLLMEIVRQKLKWADTFQFAYQAKDHEKMEHMVKEDIPRIRELYKRFFIVWREQWEKNKKRSGWETHCIRIGGLLLRIDDVQFTLLRWLDGDIPYLDELVDAPLPAARRGRLQDYNAFTFPQYHE